MGIPSKNERTGLAPLSLDCLRENSLKKRRMWELGLSRTGGQKHVHQSVKLFSDFGKLEVQIECSRPNSVVSQRQQAVGGRCFVGFGIEQNTGDIAGIILVQIFHIGENLVYIR